MSTKTYTIEELKQQAIKFISTKGTWKDEWWGPEQSLYSTGIDEFFDYLEAPDLEKQKRKELYEQLKAEFEGK
jgi:hypothetical protein